MHSIAHAVRYTARARWFHWSMAALIVLAYALILSRTQLARGSEPRLFVVQTHYWVGLLIFILAWPRLLHRRANPPPVIAPPLQSALQALATLTHVLLYAFLFVQPLMGVLSVWLEKGALPIPLSHFAVPSPFAVNEDLASQIEDLHKLTGTIFYYVIGLHVAAALFHHVVRRDNVLRRML